MTGESSFYLLDQHWSYRYSFNIIVIYGVHMYIKYAVDLKEKSFNVLLYYNIFANFIQISQP